MSSRPTIVPAGEGPTTETSVEPSSMLADLRRRAAAQRREHVTLIDVGGEFGDKLKVRYGVLPMNDMERYAELQAGGAMTNMSLAIDLMVACCKELVFVTDEGEVVLSDERGPVGLEDRLADLMDWPRPGDELTPREVVNLLFGGNALALDSHIGKLVEWMRAPERGDALGGS